jgi:hypothetical protein
MAGAPIGNTNRATQYRIKRTLEAVLEKRSKAEGRDALEKACEAVLDKANEGDIQAFKEIADRLDGKPGQAVTLAGDPDNPLRLGVDVAFVSPTPGGV